MREIAARILREFRRIAARLRERPSAADTGRLATPGLAAGPGTARSSATRTRSGPSSSPGSAGRRWLSTAIRRAGCGGEPAAPQPFGQKLQTATCTDWREATPQQRQSAVDQLVVEVPRVDPASGEDAHAPGEGHRADAPEQVDLGTSGAVAQQWRRSERSSGSDVTVATVDNAGVVRGLKAGGSTITGSLTLGGGTYNFCKVTLGNNSFISIAPGTKIRLFLDSPDRAGSGCIGAVRCCSLPEMSSPSRSGSRKLGETSRPVPSNASALSWVRSIAW